MIDRLGFAEADDRLGERVVIRITATSNLRFDTGIHHSFGVPKERVLHAAIAVMNERFLLFPFVQCLLKHIQRQVRAQLRTGAPAHDAPRKDIDHTREVRKAAPCAGVREVRHPTLIRTSCGAVRCTRYCGRSACVPGMVVHTRRPRTTPRRPIAFITRLKVQRATTRPSRRNAPTTVHLNEARSCDHAGGRRMETSYDNYLDTHRAVDQARSLS